MVNKIDLSNVHFKLATGRQIAEVASAAVSKTETITCRVVEIFPEASGGARSPHKHTEMEEVIFVLEGSGLAWVDGREIQIEKGDLLVVPKAVDHRIINPDTGKLALLCVFPSAEVEVP